MKSVVNKSECYGVVFPIPQHCLKKLFDRIKGDMIYNLILMLFGIVKYHSCFY